jgi:hypothetical protein
MCSLCLESPVTMASFIVEIAKSTDGAEPEKASSKTWVRCRSCDACHERVATLPRVRLVALPFVALGTVAWLLSMLSDAPMRVFHVEKLGSIMITTLICALVLSIPLVLVDRASTRAGKTFATSWLLGRLRAQLGPPTATPGEGWWKVHAEVPPGTAVQDAKDVLR